jgi:hypothetical protein
MRRREDFDVDKGRFTPLYTTGPSGGTRKEEISSAFSAKKILVDPPLQFRARELLRAGSVAAGVHPKILPLAGPAAEGFDVR